MTTDNLLTQRKQDHIDAVLTDPAVERGGHGFDTIRLSHRALPELDFNEVDCSTKFLGKKISFPFMIASMTGGAANNLSDINRNLAIAAEACQVPMAVGSQRAMVEDAKALASFNIREHAPSIPLIANLGAVQLNYGYGVEQAQKAINALKADALYLHLNPLQEVIQPEGDTNFKKLIEKIQLLTEQLDVPVILKEVGCGLSKQDIELGLSAGVKLFDVAGRGGTSWSRIEAHRSDNDLGILFQDWGLTTVESLQIAQAYHEDAKFIASGGIRNGIDMVKAVIMGGQLCGVAAPLLKPAQSGAAEVIEKIEQFKQEFKTAQFLLGVDKADHLHLNKSLITKTNAG